MAHYFSINFFEVIFSVKGKGAVFFSSLTFPKLMLFCQDAPQKEPIHFYYVVQFNSNYFENVLLTGS